MCRLLSALLLLCFLVACTDEEEQQPQFAPLPTPTPEPRVRIVGQAFLRTAAGINKLSGMEVFLYGERLPDVMRDVSIQLDHAAKDLHDLESLALRIEQAIAARQEFGVWADWREQTLDTRNDFHEMKYDNLFVTDPINQETFELTWSGGQREMSLRRLENLIDEIETEFLKKREDVEHWEEELGVSAAEFEEELNRVRGRIEKLGNSDSSASGILRAAVARHDALETSIVNLDGKYSFSSRSPGVYYLAARYADESGHEFLWAYEVEAFEVGEKETVLTQVNAWYDSMEDPLVVPLP